MDMRYCLESNELGLLCLERVTTVPHVRSLAKHYKQEHGIDLPEVMGKDLCWVLPWAHMLGACAQIHCVTLEKSIGSISPSWLKKVCEDVLARYDEAFVFSNFYYTHTLTRLFCRYGRVDAGQVEEETNMMFAERRWMLDRMLLGPATTSGAHADAGSNINLECSSSKDLVVLQVYFVI
jgi:hypothetical protein